MVFTAVVIGSTALIGCGDAGSTGADQDDVVGEYTGEVLSYTARPTICQKPDPSDDSKTLTQALSCGSSCPSGWEPAFEANANTLQMYGYDASCTKKKISMALDGDGSGTLDSDSVSIDTTSSPDARAYALGPHTWDGTYGYMVQQPSGSRALRTGLYTAESNSQDSLSNYCPYAYSNYNSGSTYSNHFNSERKMILDGSSQLKASQTTMWVGTHSIIDGAKRFVASPASFARLYWTGSSWSPTSSGSYTPAIRRVGDNAAPDSTGTKIAHSRSAFTYCN